MLPEKQNVQLLVIQTGSQQDLMQTIPALQKLRQLLPGAVITLLISLNEQEVNLHILPWVDDVLVCDFIGKFVNLADELALISQLQVRGFDAALIFSNFGESPYSLAYICYLAGIEIRVGQSQEFGGGVLSVCVNSQTHLEDELIDLLVVS